MTQEYIIAPILVLTQLSIALNIVCIAVYNKANFFIEIIEETVLCTKTDIDNEIKDAENKIIKNHCYIEGLDDSRKNESIVEEMLNSCDTVQQIYSNENIKNLWQEIESKCKPHCLPGLFAYCTMYAMIFMLFLLFLECPWVQSALRYFVLLSVLPIIIFVAIKAYIDRVLYCEIEKIKNHDESKRDKKIKRKQLIKSLYVINAFCAISAILVVSLLLPLLEEKFVIFYVSDKFVLLLATFIAYFSFVIYIVVYYLYSQRRKTKINEFFEEGRNKITEMETDYNAMVRIFRGNIKRESITAK
ncbi:hypothetical protein [Dysgonomonas termitidis]|uniref:Uncharacterized protein n=1 Tax=Dysgonomonas termitidis TaxID=1516126 RepID=A0ABV9KVE6_9BACT